MKSLSESVFAIVGLGLMGGSFALALRAANACNRIIAIERDAATREQAIARGIVDDAHVDLAIVSQADIVVLATPVRTIIDQLPRVGESARAGVIVLDLGSTKREIARAMETLPARVQPIGGHPMCGKETSGLRAADANLFRNAVFVLTPLARTSPETLSSARSLVRALGAQPMVFDAAQHDRIVAATSHLPFALAAALMATADELARADESLFKLAASGFRDTSRLAASDTTMMGDVLLTNGENVANVMRDCARHLTALAAVIDRKDEIALRAFLERAAAKRRNLFSHV